MNKKLTDYLTETLPNRQEWVSTLEKEATADHVPIMDRVGMNFVMQLIHMNKPDCILEIGTAIGYSALRMLEANPQASIITIERDETRYLKAMEHIKQLNKQEQINVIYGDALEKLQELKDQDATFNLIFIDAAKGQYQRFFELAEPMLEDNGMIISDNVLFRGYVADSENVPSRYTKMVQKIRAYNEMLMNHSNYTTSIVPIGDGVAVSYKKGNERRGI